MASHFVRGPYRSSPAGRRSARRPGGRAVPRHVGAFVLWDAQEHELIAVRDQIGVKPLYYVVADDVLVAASELRTVIAHPLVRRRLDPNGVVEYLAFGFVAGDGTLVQDVKKLPPGHMLRLQDGVVTLTQYWDALPPRPAERPGEAGLTSSLCAHIDAAVDAALVSDVPVSLMLSGGLDSSVIAAVAARHVKPADLTAYSVSFGLPTDEVDAAGRLAQRLGLRFKEISLSPGDARAGVRALVVATRRPDCQPNVDSSFRRSASSPRGWKQSPSFW